MRPSQMPPRRPAPPPFPLGAGRIAAETAPVRDWAAHVAAGRIGGAAALPIVPPGGEPGCASPAAIGTGVRR